MEKTSVEAALETLRPSLDADGFELGCGSISFDGSVTITLRARPDACMDCLVPDDVLVQILDAALREHDSSFARVTLTKLGFDDVPGIEPVRGLHQLDRQAIDAESSG